MHAPQLVLHRDGTFLPGLEQPVIAAFHQGEWKPVRIFEGQGGFPEAAFDGGLVDIVLGEPLLPVCQAARRDCKRRFHRQACSRPAGLHIGPGEEGKVGPGIADFVGVE